MRDFASLTGPWVGLSMQEGFRLSEKIYLRIYDRYVRGEGTDADGEFLLDGSYDPDTQQVLLTRRYIKAPRNPGQIGYPFLYSGTWDGEMVCGRWCMSTHPDEGDVFEMWPEREEDMRERRSIFEELEQVAPCPKPSELIGV